LSLLGTGLRIRPSRWAPFNASCGFGSAEGAMVAPTVRPAAAADVEMPLGADTAACPGSEETGGIGVGLKTAVERFAVEGIGGVAIEHARRVVAGNAGGVRGRSKDPRSWADCCVAAGS
jgi:hypothetical protein